MVCPSHNIWSVSIDRKEYMCAQIVATDRIQSATEHYYKFMFSCICLMYSMKWTLNIQFYCFIIELGVHTKVGNTVSVLYSKSIAFNLFVF